MPINYENNNITGSGSLFINNSGNFASGLYVNSIPVSLSGHTHLVSDITNFGSGVSGLLPTGTVNYIPKFGNGGSGLNNSIIVQSGNFIGIGTNPVSGYVLTVNDTLKTSYATFDSVRIGNPAHSIFTDEGFIFIHSNEIDIDTEVRYANFYNKLFIDYYNPIVNISGDLNINGTGVSLSGHTHGLKIGDGVSDKINYLSSDTLNIIGTGGTSILYNDTSNTITISGAPNLSNVVFTTGNQNISGIKTFLNNIVATGQLSAVSGYFTNSLQLNGTGVSLSGHSHSISDITNFGSGVSGLLPTNLVYTTGNQNISGIKTFFNNTLFSGNISSPTGTFGKLISNVDFEINGTMNINAAATITANGPITFIGNPYVVSGNGYFTSGLFVGPTGSATPVSVSGHRQLYSTIDNFCTGVAECVNTPLLAGTGISLSYVNGTGLYINASGGIQISSSSSGFVVKTGINNYVTRYITNGNNINISYADGMSGNPVISLSGNLDLIQNITSTGTLRANSGIFTSGITLNGTGVSLIGHSHTISDISNFGSGVSGLLPINLVYTTGNQTISGVKTFLDNVISSGQISAPTGKFDYIVSDQDFTINGTMNISAAANILANGPITFKADKYIVSGAGYFTSGLFVGPTGSPTGVSLVGHNHTYSEITNFCTGVADCVNTELLTNSGIQSIYGTNTVQLSLSGIPLSLYSLNTSGFITATGNNGVTTRTISASGLNILVGSGNGVSGNPIIGLNPYTSGLNTLQASYLYSSSGYFNSLLQVNGTGVSLAGHSHTISDISNFGSGVTGLLPTGTANYIAKFGNGGSGLNNSAIVQSGNFIGIGINPESGIDLKINNQLKASLGSFSTITAVPVNFSEEGWVVINSNRLIDNTIAGIEINTELGYANFYDKLFIDAYNPVVNITGNLNINGTGVSLNGHSHEVSDITNFGSGVSGLLPVKDIIAGSGIQVGAISGAYTITAFGVAASSASSLITKADNKTGSTISKMSVVYINGGHGNRPTIQKSIASAESTSSKTYGVTASNINNNQTGDIIVVGALIDVDTNQFGASEGSTLYLSPSISGGITATKPLAPNHLVAVGKIVRNHSTQGIIEVSIQNGFELYELHDVAVTGVTDGQFLQYNSNSGLWVPSSSGNFTSLNVNGSGIFTKNITASGFIKSGGTSSQFLKADGSVDSTTYQGYISDLNSLYVGFIDRPYVTSDDSLGDVLLSIDDSFSALYNDNTVVRTTGIQSISGIKTFNNTTTFTSGLNTNELNIFKDITILGKNDIPTWNPSALYNKTDVVKFENQYYTSLLDFTTQCAMGSVPENWYCCPDNSYAAPTAGGCPEGGSGIYSNSFSPTGYKPGWALLGSGDLAVQNSYSYNLYNHNNITSSKITVNDLLVKEGVIRVNNSFLNTFNMTINSSGISIVDTAASGTVKHVSSISLPITAILNNTSLNPSTLISIWETQANISIGDLVLFTNFNSSTYNGIYKVETPLPTGDFGNVRFVRASGFTDGTVLNNGISIYVANNNKKFILNKDIAGTSIVGSSSLLFTVDDGQSVMNILNNKDVVFSEGVSSQVITAEQKFFKIKHPDPESGYSHLQYGSLESPYNGVRLTGKDKLNKGVCEVYLPNYLKHLIYEEDISIQLTNHGHHKILYVDKIDLKNNKFIIKGYKSKSGGPYEFYWSFTGIRTDVPNLIPEQ
jgi:hypothetical protein